jgi:hypothetical protein
LLPPPQRVRRRAEVWKLPELALVAIDADAGSPITEEALARLERAGLRCRLAMGEPAAVRLELRGLALRGSESYELNISPQGATITARTEAGLRYGLLTLAQWLELHARSAAVACLEVEDWPDLAHRGVMLDISRDKVPKQKTLLELIARLAELKFNQLQLYMEHTFAYRGHEVVWREASPLTAQEVRELDRFAAARGIELIPNQNSLGHFHRWLIHEPYRPLAECPAGVQHPWSEEPEPFSLCPVDPRCLDLLGDLYDQLLPCFSSRQLNAGLDESFDIGLGRSAEACQARGRQRVYLDYAVAVHRLLAQRGCRMQMWADLLLDWQAPLAELPRDVVPLVWGYEADHPFAEQASRIDGTGHDIYLCPGTSSWNSFAGRGHNALANVASAAQAARSAPVRGLLVTDWGDHGHLQPLASSWPGFLAAAAFAWNASAAEDAAAFPLAPLLDRYAFDDPGAGLGEDLVALADCYRQVGGRNYNGSTLFYLLFHHDQGLEHRRFAGVSPQSIAAASEAIEDARQRLERRRLRPHNELVRDELRWVADILRYACHLGMARLRHDPASPSAALPPKVRRRLRGELGAILDRHPHLWLERNRPGGLDRSTRWLHGLHRRLSP